MCNLSDRIEEKGIEQGKMESVLALIQNLHFSFEEAVSALNLPDDLIETCRRYVIQEMNVE